MNAEQKKFIDALFVELRRKLIFYADGSLNNIALAEEAVQEALPLLAASRTMCAAAPIPRVGL